MGNLHRVVVSGTNFLYFLFGGLEQPKAPSTKDLCGYHHPNYFAGLRSPWNGSIFKGLQKKLINSIEYYDSIVSNLCPVPMPVVTNATIYIFV